MTDSEPIRVMLVDDSAVVRRLVAGILREQPDINVVGIAVNGQEALDQIDMHRPHVVVLDVEMPVLDGLATLRKLRPRWPKLPVIMFSTLTQRSAEATLDALTHGANDYVTKPSNSSREESMAAVRDGLVPLVRAWGAIGRRRSAEPPAAVPVAGAQRSARAAAPAAPTRVALRPAPQYRRNVGAITIGSSTGGPNALAELIPSLPANLQVPVLVVQHMPEMFTRLLAGRLDAASPLRVVEAEDGAVVEAGHVYVAKGGVHMAVHRVAGKVQLSLIDSPPENSCRPAVDVLFRTAVQVWRSGLLAVVLTGMGEDGLNGAREIVAAGGEVLTQDEVTSVVWGMPGAVARNGLSAANLPLSGLPNAILGRLRSPSPVGARR
ncbi:chemotaxis response regulator protein-glutamate methylesterase [Acidiferrimicrobium sp. IK]|uniref:protein-glutamate methylesterase/protein-glutamine glutaminase n=1 Tax=Acidiferrimicrobium sp. IK TaxID=2871700 RepID=UPI0021CB07D7|nr:chemotaxis response regulator protein-glutamate methylesterase [Acidiferrimicrobium sp. IK]MCU4185660.1 chemotaxis response regulator protein-glutamate methylesterase [Acidiferrimicrobium sp. IK]